MKFTLETESLIKEKSAHDWIIYSSKRVISSDRYLSKTGWSSQGEDRKPVSLCESFTHPSLNKWEKASHVLESLKEGERVEVRKVRREISWADHTCVEEKIVNFVTLKGRTFAFTGDPTDIPSVLEFLKESSEFRPTTLFMDRGTLILDPEATGFLLRALMEMLKGDSRLLSKEERGLPDITLYDDPLIPYSHVFYTFDDEGVKTKRKELVGNGQVLDYLGTLYLGSEGNGRGIYPKPDFFNAVLKPGDWKIHELMDETRNGFLILGARGSEVVRKSIRIKPGKVVHLGNGELMIREIAIPFSDLSTLDAITGDTRLVYLDEDHGAVAPFIRVSGRLLY
ncbi:metallopeptidase TldD-related protein [Metallosphaera hakonensis]|uniref:Peptidase n=1 Tax=Metallosphaera hakonensis JCM 8857 = DSM 7519 TaxID=1293036 RepID=A0A2U9IW45_9CREN|nr:metallopeptidase TldD-related protein [Metallosphaera hakonensis]AWS00225.1 peptidase [Metallosphaera hakonensis JCM 8857 = DSM 7519]